MASGVNPSPKWSTVVQWAQDQPSDKQVCKCVKDIEVLREWQNGTDVGSRLWQVCNVVLFRSQVPLNTSIQRFGELKRRLLEYLEVVPNDISFSVQQLQRIQTTIEENETLVVMWNDTKKHYFNLAREGKVPSEMPDYVFGFTYFGSLADRVRGIKAQILDLSRPRSQAFLTTSQWILRNTNLTHAFMPPTISNAFTNITWIDLSHNEFETVGDFSHLNKLKRLLLTGNCLQTIAAAHLPVSLELLDLDQNLFETQPNLARLTRLESLDLSNNRLAAISSRALPPSLQFLDVRRNPLTKVDSVQAAIPNCEIKADANPGVNPKKRGHGA